MTLLLLVRHGETPDNARRIMQGQTQGALNERGRQQARLLARRLKDKPIDVFLSSDLRRAVQTAYIIAAPHFATPEETIDAILTTPLLRERDWGSFTGRFIPSLRDEPWPDDIESLEDLTGRARAFLSYVSGTFPRRTVLAVGHGIINKAVQSVFFKRPMNEIKKMENGEMRTLTL